MRRSIATVSMSGPLRDKLEAIAAARFHGYELFEPDLLYYDASPSEVGAGGGPGGVGGGPGSGVAGPLIARSAILFR